MARYISDIEKELLALPTQEQARIAHDLIRSLNKDEVPLSQEEWEAAWMEEVKDAQLLDICSRQYPRNGLTWQRSCHNSRYVNKMGDELCNIAIFDTNGCPQLE